MKRKHIGPAPSERALIQLWDRIGEERSRAGEKAAAALATKALKAIAPTDESGAPRKVQHNRMGWEYRKGKPYYYRKERQDHKVVSTYLYRHWSARDTACRARPT